MAHQDFPAWQQVVRGKHLIFDSDAIISIISFKAESLLGELKKLGVSLHFVSPVLLEIMNTDSSTEKVLRNTFLANHGFSELPLTPTEIKYASIIQQSMPLGVKSKPSAADFYLGGTLARYAKTKNAFLLTSNTRDFPTPLYTRESVITLTNQTDVKSISVVGLDTTKLVTV